MVFCFLAFSFFLFGWGYMCLNPVWYQRLFKSKYLCHRCQSLIDKEEALDAGRYEDRP